MSFFKQNYYSSHKASTSSELPFEATKLSGKSIYSQDPQTIPTNLACITCTGYKYLFSLLTIMLTQNETTQLNFLTLSSRP